MPAAASIPALSSPVGERYFAAILRGLAMLADNPGATVDPASPREAVMAELDALPSVVGGSGNESTLLVHLARGATEVRAMLAAGIGA